MVTSKSFTALRNRANEKLEYADVHLEELRNYANKTSNDVWENAHQESAFFHLAGAVEAILHEVNIGYKLGLEIHDVKWNRVRVELNSYNLDSSAFRWLESLRRDDESWLSLLFAWRNHGTHRKQISKVIHLSTTPFVDNEFIDPRSGKLQTNFPGLRCLEVLERLRAEVEALITECRRIDPRL